MSDIPINPIITVILGAGSAFILSNLLFYFLKFAVIRIFRLSEPLKSLLHIILVTIFFLMIVFAIHFALVVFHNDFGFSKAEVLWGLFLFLILPLAVHSVLFQSKISKRTRRK